MYDALVARLQAKTKDSSSSQSDTDRDAKPKRKRKLPKALNKSEAEALLATCNLRAPTGLRDRLMLEFMYRAGLRVGEVRRLEVRDVDVVVADLGEQLVAGTGEVAGVRGGPLRGHGRR